MKNVKKAALTLASVAMVALLPGQALADKSGVAMTGVKAIGKIGHNNDHFDPTSTEWQPILELDLQTQNHAEVAFDMALQCGVILDTTVASKNLEREAAEAEASVKVRIAVTFDGETDPVYAMPGEGGVAANGVTYCRGLQRLEGMFSGGDCTADLETGLVTCATDEELRLYTETLQANAFNYVLTGIPVGTHHIVVEAMASSDAAIFGDGATDAAGEALIGLGSIFVDEVQLINGWGFSEY